MQRSSFIVTCIFLFLILLIFFAEVSQSAKAKARKKVKKTSSSSSSLSSSSSVSEDVAGDRSAAAAAAAAGGGGGGGGEQQQQPRDPSIPTVNISKWEYCEGCKVTVDAYSLASYKRMKDMQSQKVPDFEILESSALVEGICDSQPFEELYDAAMKHSCIKIFNDHQTEFGKVFEGKIGVLTVNAPNEVYMKRRIACVDKLSICSSAAFNQPVPKEEQSRCKACQVIAHDLEQYLKIMNKKSTKKKKMELILEEVCGKLGFNHQPFSWLDQVCEEMTEDRSEQIQSIKKFRDRVAATGLNPDKRLRDMICDELYECDKPAAKNNKKPVVKKYEPSSSSISSSSSSNDNSHDDDDAEL